jgi:CRISPR-associated exonuclease Cas4
MNITGTDLHAFKLCDRRAWLKRRQIGFTSTNEHIKAGALDQKHHYQRATKELQLPSNISSGSVIDFINFYGQELHETKVNNKAKKADRIQMLFYLSECERLGIHAITGIIHYPNQRQTQSVQLDPKSRKELSDIITNYQSRMQDPNPPAAEKKSFCPHCSLFTYCFS